MQENYPAALASLDAAFVLEPEDSAALGVRALALLDSSNLEEAAKNLFAALREFDKMKIDVVLAERVPDTGIGRAINDRLRRAAATENFE